MLVAGASNGTACADLRGCELASSKSASDSCMAICGESPPHPLQDLGLRSAVVVRTLWTLDVPVCRRCVVTQKVELVPTLVLASWQAAKVPATLGGPSAGGGGGAPIPTWWGGEVADSIRSVSDNAQPAEIAACLHRFE